MNADEISLAPEEIAAMKASHDAYMADLIRDASSGYDIIGVLQNLVTMRKLGVTWAELDQAFASLLQKAESPVLSGLDRTTSGAIGQP
jgi:hypothetical protein